MRFAIAVALGMSACNVFGVGETVSNALDGDRDGVIDTDDNCPLIANADQADSDDDGAGDACDANLVCDSGMPTGVDSDGDGIDDGCDPCDGPDHDEDGDGLVDDCDNCPVHANPAQDNSDGDALGDLCDPSNMVTHRLRQFDGFGGTTLSATWRPTVGWSVDGDLLIGNPPNHLGLATAPNILGSVDRSWAVQVGLRLPSGAAVGQVVGFAMVNLNGDTTACLLRSEGADSWRLRGVDGPSGFPELIDGTVSVPSNTDLELVMTFRSMAGIFVECDLVGRETMAVSISTLSGVIAVSNPELVSDVEARFTHVDIVR